MKLTSKFVIAFIFTALIPIATLGHLSYFSAKAALQKQLLEDLTLVAETKEGHLYSFFEAVKGRTLDFSSDGFIRDSVEAVQRVDAKAPRFLELQSSLASHLRLNKMPLDGNISLILVIDSSGRVIAATDEHNIGEDESKDEYFMQGRKGIYLSDVHISHHLAAGEQRPYKIAVSAPLTGRESDALLGVIVSFYDTRELEKILSGEFQMEKGALSGGLGRRKTLDIYLVNKENYLVTPSSFSGAVLNQRVATLPVLECAGGRETTAMYKSFHDNEVIGASMCIPTMGWTMLVEINKEEAFAPVAVLRARTIILGLAIALLALLLAYFFAKGIINPVAALSKVTKKLAGGDFSVRAPVESKDEIGELALSFNKMAAQLAESQYAILTGAAKLEQSNIELQNILSVTSHDLQEPLRKVQVFGDRLKTKSGEALNDQGREYLEIMQNEAKRMQTLINGLLRFSRVTTRAQPFVPVDLSTVMHGVFSDLEVRVAEVKGRVEVGDLPAIEADPLQMHQLFRNLIGNALKFHKKDEQPVVKVNGRFVHDKGKNTNDNAADDELCQITVADNGIGFNKKYAERIFRVFQRLHGRNQYEGTGIGLSVCHKIVERHGGSIRAKSTPGQGATFIITLPVKQPLTVQPPRLPDGGQVRHPSTIKMSYPD